MTLHIELWTVVGFFITFMSFFVGLARWVISRVDERYSEGISALREGMARAADNRAAIERDLMTLRAELPTIYVRRDDYIRGQAVIEAKLDAMYERISNLPGRRVP